LSSVSPGQPAEISGQADLTDLIEDQAGIGVE
jgi:hypothetical protein